LSRFILVFIANILLLLL